MDDSLLDFKKVISTKEFAERVVIMKVAYFDEKLKCPETTDVLSYFLSYKSLSDAQLLTNI